MKLSESSPDTRRQIANTTLGAISNGSYMFNNFPYDLHSKCEQSKRATHYFAPDSSLSQWSAHNSPSSDHKTEIRILPTSTLTGARLLASAISSDQNVCSSTDSAPAGLRKKIGILNFASAKTPGGGFLNGAQAQEESIARSSTLFPALTTTVAKQFYDLHNHDTKGGYYSHAMIYSPHVVIFRDDDGGWVEPLEVDVLTSCAVNAKVVRNTLFGRVARSSEEVKIGKTMRERMARILYSFEKHGVQNIVLGSFGTGVFQNDVSLVAAIWADLLVTPGARFYNSFECIVFAILGKETFQIFKQTFDERTV